jgi:predicted Zn-dependent peptidase
MTSSPVRALMAGWRVPPRKDPDWPALNLLAAVLARGSGSRLDHVLVSNPPLCLSVQGDLDNHRDESLFYLSAPLAPEADSAEVERRLFGEVGRLMAEPVSADELERAKRQLESVVWLGLQTSRARAQALGQAEMLVGDWRDAARQVERIRACTAENLMRASLHLDMARRVVVWMVPASSAAGAMGGRP